MPIIDPDSEIVNESSCTYWENELINLRILLNAVETGILTLTQSGHSSYTLDTGQSSQKVMRLSMVELKDMRTDLMSQIRDLELFLGVGCKPAIQQVRPGW